VNIGAEAAEAAAGAALADRRNVGDLLFAAWADAAVGAPVAVHDVAGAQSYWLVPLKVGAKVVGFVRVGAAGGVEAIGLTCRSRAALETCPTVATGLSAAEALARVHAEGGLAAGETLSPPRFVHDGPPGREAWLVESAVGGRPARWFFVTPAGIYARTAGARHRTDPSSE
jgi:hypothetical protein